MQRRLESLRRLLAIHNDLRRIAELKLSGLQQRRQAAHKDEERLVSYLSEQHILTPAYARTITEKLRAVGRAKRRLEQEMEAQAKDLLECTRRVGQAERAVDAVAEQWRRVEERRELEAAIEAESNRKRASFR